MSVERELIFLWKRQSVVKSSYKLELGVWTSEGAVTVKNIWNKVLLGSAKHVIFYLLLKRFTTHLCFVVIQMNYTRQRWSKNFNCVKIHTDLVSVVALTVFFCFLPVIFYTSVKLQYDYSHERKPG